MQKIKENKGIYKKRSYVNVTDEKLFPPLPKQNK